MGGGGVKLPPSPFQGNSVNNSAEFINLQYSVDQVYINRVTKSTYSDDVSLLILNPQLIIFSIVSIDH